MLRENIKKIFFTVKGQIIFNLKKTISKNRSFSKFFFINIYSLIKKNSAEFESLLNEIFQGKFVSFYLICLNEHAKINGLLLNDLTIYLVVNYINKSCKSL